jgi:hypothetical protein
MAPKNEPPPCQGRFLSHAFLTAFKSSPSTSPSQIAALKEQSVPLCVCACVSLSLPHCQLNRETSRRKLQRLLTNMALPKANADSDWVDISHPVRESKRRPTDPGPLHEAMQRNAQSLLVKYPKSPLFHVEYDSSGGSLSTVYQKGYPIELQQQFNCHTCSKFMKNYGDLALVDEETGALLPLFWNPSDNIDPFIEPVNAVAKLFANRMVTQVFKLTQQKLHAGIRECGGWAHMFFEFPSTRVQAEDIPGLSTASSTELASMLAHVLTDYDLDTVRRTSQLLLEDRLPYADGHKASIRWLLDLKENKSHKLEAADEVAKHNLTHHLAASSFLGCLKQLRSGAVGVLLSHVKENKSFQELERSWSGMTQPLAYMRPTAAPSAGNIAAAERLFSSLGLTKEDMRREYLTESGIPDNAYIFRDRQCSESTTPKKGIFGHIVPKKAPKRSYEQSKISHQGDIDMPPISMSFSTFARKVLPNAQKIEYRLPDSIGLYYFITGLPGSKPLMQWHDDTHRVSWYTHNTPVNVASHGLHSGWTPVPYIIPFPHLWDGIPATTAFPLSEDMATAFKYYHSKNGFRYLIGLKGIAEPGDLELCLFPTFMKSEFHGVRSTIEKYSSMGRIEKPRGAAMVGGVEIDRSSHKGNHVFRVTDDKGQRGTYEIVLFE